MSWVNLKLHFIIFQSLPPTYLQAEEDITLARQQHLHKMKQAGIFWSSKLLFQDFYFVLFLNEKCLTKLGSWTKAAPHSPPQKNYVAIIALCFRNCRVIFIISVFKLQATILSLSEVLSATNIKDIFSMSKSMNGRKRKLPHPVRDTKAQLLKN